MLLDRQPYEYPPEAWTNLRNTRCYDRSLWTTFGHAPIMGVPIVKPYYIQPTVDNTGGTVWAYPGLAAVGATDGSTHTDITRTVGGAYVGTDANLWNGGNFGGIMILNNGVDVPQAWITPTLATKLVNLANWPANTLAAVVRVFGRFLVALDVSVSGTRKSQLVKWSDEADIGAVPSSWDPADATKKAGEWPLLETDGAILDGIQLGDRFIIYKTDSVYSMVRIGGRFVFQFKQLFKDFGILAQRCYGEYRGRHIVATPEDILIHDGLQYESLLDDKMLRWWLGRVDATNSFRSFITMNFAENEAWICIPETGNVFPNLALILNLKDGTTTIRDLPNVAHIDYGRPLAGGATYDVQDIYFDLMVGYFGQDQASAFRKRLIGVSPEAERNQLLQSEDLSTSWTLTNVAIQTNVEGTADGLRPDNTNNQHYTSQVYTKLASEAQTWTLRSKLKPDGYNYGVLRLDDNAGNGVTAGFDLTNGTVIGTALIGAGFSVAAAAVNGAVDALGYYDCYLTVTSNAAASVRGLIGVNSASGTGLQTYVGDVVSRLRVKESQLRRDVLGTYQVTTTIRATGGIFLYDSGIDFDGVAFTSLAERVGQAVIGQTRTGEPKTDISMNKLLTEFWPKMEILFGSTVDFYFGRQDKPAGPITWEGPFTFNPLTDLKCDPVLECRLFGVRLQTSARQIWRLDGYDVEIAATGKL